MSGVFDAFARVNLRLVMTLHFSLAHDGAEADTLRGISLCRNVCGSIAAMAQV